jgi:hypothetical protein
MAQSKLPRDQSGAFVQALAPSTNVSDSVGGSSRRSALPANCDVVRVCADTDCFIKFGDVTVVAASTDLLFLKGAEVFAIPAGATHVAYIQQSAGGTVSVSAMV